MYMTRAAVKERQLKRSNGERGQEIDQKVKIKFLANNCFNSYEVLSYAYSNGVSEQTIKKEVTYLKEKANLYLPQEFF